MNKKRECESQFKIVREFNSKNTPREVLRQIIRMKSRQIEMEAEGRK